MKILCAKYFCDQTMFIPLWLLIFDTLRKILPFFDTRCHTGTLVNMTYTCVLKVCPRVFEQTKIKISKMV